MTFVQAHQVLRLLAEDTPTWYRSPTGLIAVVGPGVVGEGPRSRGPRTAGGRAAAVPSLTPGVAPLSVRR
ncbi:hypothetical protein CNX65_23560 [Actinosynnema pretiosum]|uniref:Uncharacterized protein n=1 Tax=Actinosynnema pretiosum TaxID=42197 RepID=A0A290ZA55_9PSEU|nr:hypothetical protein CNX65_23560 [Actinosynnema pretiosum]